MLSQLRSVLADADYTEAGIGAALGRTNGDVGFPFTEVPLLLRRLDDARQGPLAGLIKLFSLGCQVPLAEAAQALRPLESHRLDELLQFNDGMVSSPLRLTPYGGFVFAHDPSGPPPLPHDYVMGIGPATRTLAGVTVRQHVERALDIGTGCGVQALLAARHAEQVIAGELNPRGVWLTKLNTALNGVENVECRQGSLFEPVAGMDFDLIVSNPPFVISPDSSYVFRDSGRPGDTMSRAVVAQAAPALREGAFAHVLCNWTHRRDQDWWEPLLDWVTDSGCDALLLHYHSQDGLTYAAQWHADIQASDRTSYESALDRWRDYYRRTGIERIASGVVILRRRSSGGPNWIRMDEMPRAPVGSGSDHVLRVFDAYDFLADHDDVADLLQSTFQPVDNHQLAQRLVYRDGYYAVAETTLALEQGVGLQASIPTATLPVLLKLDGTRPLRAVIAEVATESGTPIEDLEEPAVQTVRELFSRGLIFGNLAD